LQALTLPIAVWCLLLVTTWPLSLARKHVADFLYCLLYCSSVLHVLRLQTTAWCLVL
jgi:hypothetical protein